MRDRDTNSEGPPKSVLQNGATGTQALSGIWDSCLSEKRSPVCLLSSDIFVCTPVLCVLDICNLHLSCKIKTCPSIWKQLEGKDSTWKAATRWLLSHLGSHDTSCFTQGICSVANCIISLTGEMTSFLESSKGWRVISGCFAVHS